MNCYFNVLSGLCLVNLNTISSISYFQRVVMMPVYSHRHEVYLNRRFKAVVIVHKSVGCCVWLLLLLPSSALLLLHHCLKHFKNRSDIVRVYSFSPCCLNCRSMPKLTQSRWKTHQNAYKGIQSQPPSQLNNHSLCLWYNVCCLFAGFKFKPVALPWCSQA